MRKVLFGLHVRRPRLALLLGEGRAVRALGAGRALAALGLVEARGLGEPVGGGGHVAVEGALLGLELRRLHQQRHVAAGHLGQGGGDLDGGDVLLALEVLDQLAELDQLAGGQGVADLLLELGLAHVVDVGDGRQLHRRDRLAGGALDRAQQVPFARGDEQDRLAAAAGATGAADAVHVAFRCRAARRS